MASVSTFAAVRLWSPVVLWAAVIFALSSVSDLGTGLGTWDLVLRKLAHAAEFAVLGALLLRALGDELARLNRHAENAEGFQLLARELRNLNESLNALAYAALGQSPRVRRAK